MLERKSLSDLTDTRSFSYRLITACSNLLACFLACLFLVDQFGRRPMVRRRLSQSDLSISPDPSSKPSSYTSKLASGSCITQATIPSTFSSHV